MGSKNLTIYAPLPQQYVVPFTLQENVADEPITRKVTVNYEVFVLELFTWTQVPEEQSVHLEGDGLFEVEWEVVNAGFSFQSGRGLPRGLWGSTDRGTPILLRKPLRLIKSTVVNLTVRTLIPRVGVEKVHRRVDIDLHGYTGNLEGGDTLSAMEKMLALNSGDIPVTE